MSPCASCATRYDTRRYRGEGQGTTKYPQCYRVLAARPELHEIVGDPPRANLMQCLFYFRIMPGVISLTIAISDGP